LSLGISALYLQPRKVVKALDALARVVDRILSYLERRGTFALLPAGAVAPLGFSFDGVVPAASRC
jgi:hypothetical protein